MVDKANNAKEPTAMTSNTRGGERRSPRRAKRSSSDGRLTLTDGVEVSRLFAYLLSHYIQRIDRERRAAYNSDLDMACVAEIVGTAALEPRMRDREFRDAYRNFSNIVGTEGQRGINAQSVAGSAGIPRETVRRKLKRLTELGFLLEKSPGQYIQTPGALQQPQHLAAIDRVIRESVRFMNECIEQGLVRWVPAKNADESDR